METCNLFMFCEPLRGWRHVRVTEPKHGSWLNIAECEVSVLSRQCLDRCMSDALDLGAEVNAWQAEHKRTANRVNWQFTTKHARQKLRRLYPVSLRHDEHETPPQPTKVFN